jgi:excisionase family DNA binding protein
MNAALHQETYLPEGAGDKQLAEVHDFLRALEAGRERPEPAYFLSGAEPGERVELPEELYRVLRQVVDALRSGLAVTVAPQTQTLTTQQAADLLGVSRPTVIRLLDSGEIPFERVNTHRRIELRELLAYRERRRAAQYAALAATAIDEDEDVDDVLPRLKRARKELAERRRRRTD